MRRGFFDAHINAKSTTSSTRRERDSKQKTPQEAAKKNEDQISLQSLPKAALNVIWRNLLCVDDVLALSATSKTMRKSSRESDAWQVMCERRWGTGIDGVQPHLTDINEHDSTFSLNCDYKHLFWRKNGWQRPALQHQRKSANCCAGACQNLDDGIIQTFQIGFDLKIVMSEFPRHRGITFNPIDGWRSPRCGKLPETEIDGMYYTPPPCSLEIVDASTGVVAFGDMAGGQFIVKIPETKEKPKRSRPTHEQENALAAAGTQILFELHPTREEGAYPVSSLHYSSNASKLFGLWEQGEAVNFWAPEVKSLVRAIDVPSGTVVGTAHLPLNKDRHDLCTILPIGNSGSELVGGAVQLSDERVESRDCRKCDQQNRTALCTHQGKGANAALVFFDLRAGEAEGRVVGFHELPHQRSLYPAACAGKLHPSEPRKSSLCYLGQKKPRKRSCGQPSFGR